MKQFLKDHAEPMPAWLANHRPGQTIDMRQVLKGRTLYYPGSAFDGLPIRTFNKSQSVHTFIYVDYMFTKEELEKALERTGFAGYHLVDSIEINANDLTPKGWQPHITTAEAKESRERASRSHILKTQPYCLLKIFERNEDKDDDWGSHRFAMIYLCADGIASYDAIYGNKNAAPPFALVLQDYGFGGNYNSFGADGLMAKIAQRTQVFPKFILGASEGCTKIWTEYDAIPDLEPVRGGMHCTLRKLYRKWGTFL